MDGFLPIFFLAVVLKIPVLGAIWLVWWAMRNADAPERPASDDRGGPRLPDRPRSPRRGPHGGEISVPPPRARPPREHSRERSALHR